MSVPDNSNVSSIRHESKTWGFESPTVRGIFCPKNFHFHKNIRSCVENESCCPRTVIISNINFTSNIYIPYKIMDAITNINI